jgi:TrmH family RNA methyltransferase
MANFGLDELVLVDPCAIGDDAYRRAKHGSFILDSAVVTDSLKEAVRDCFLIVGTSGIVTEGQNNNYIRVPISVRELKERISGYGEKTAILFGREDIGLFRDELALCDILVTVPSSPQYPVLNISHAAAIVMYELSDSELPKPEPADADEKDMVFGFFDDLLDSVGYPEHRKETTSVMFRRMMGRSVPTKWDYNTIMGVVGDAARIINRPK